ncbi:hypothetical protein Pmani_035009 [Petrolisthes manimaculis]|uniref:Uncharacterized protein n=1 Tax=Petrolisthes manimaculis TaxID=1843537 RepID=A0AAE1NN82_9EUCA|nr:hypothetical protein Pmani_035009 [Petrolisthes manimaculis]
MISCRRFTDGNEEGVKSMKGYKTVRTHIFPSPDAILSRNGMKVKWSGDYLASQDEGTNGARREDQT